MVINPIVRVYITIIRIPIKGGMTIPNIATLDHGTYVLEKVFSLKYGYFVQLHTGRGYSYRDTKPFPI